MLLRLACCVGFSIGILASGDARANCAGTISQLMSKDTEKLSTRYQRVTKRMEKERSAKLVAEGCRIARALERGRAACDAEVVGRMDADDPLAHCRSRFDLPAGVEGDVIRGCYRFNSDPTSVTNGRDAVAQRQEQHRPRAQHQR